MLSRKLTVEVVSMRRVRRAAAVWLALSASSLFLSAANIGTSVPIIGTVTDLAYDSQRQLVYLANRDQNRIEVYSAGAQRLLAPINVGTTPVSVAVSIDKQTLYI